MIMLGVGVTSYLVKSGVLFITKASPDNTPKNVRITNVSDSSFSISYTTTKLVTGAISFGTSVDNLKNIALDDRDQQAGNVGLYNLHHISLRNLKPSTTYYFSITSGKDTFMNNNLPFKQTTGPVITSSPPSQNPITGKVVMPDGQTPDEALIYVTTEGAQTISTLVDKNGNYVLPINSIRSDNLESYVPVSNNTVFNMLLIDQALEESNVSFLINQANPVPLIVLSKNYNFVLSNAPIASQSANLQFHFSSFTASMPQVSQKAQIIVPKKNEGFTDQKPLFTGTASPSANVRIVIHSQTPIEGSVQADTSGNWEFRPDQQLSPGNHTISITTRDKSGILQTITQNFTVYAAGTQINGSAIISPTPTILTPTPSLTATPSPTLTLSPPPASSTADLTPSASPTATVAPVAIVVSPTAILTKTPRLVTGSKSALFVGIAGIITTISGAVLFLLSHGGI